jgi:uncharacterized protein (TIGR02996 family)
MFTVEDKSFIIKILSNPAELTAWLVYADWLDEHGNVEHAEYLRLMARRGQISNTELEYYEVEARLEALRATLDPNWVVVFDRPKIENCDAAFRFRCPKQWESLKITGDPAVRHCDACDKKVHYCRTLPEAQAHARQGDCVAVQLGVLRYPGDLKPPPEEELEDEMVMGDFAPHIDAFPDGPGLYDEPTPPPRRPWWKFW